MAATFTVFVVLPTTSACTGTVIVAVVPVGIVPRLQVTVFALTVHVPSVVVIGDWQLAKLQY
ncbi:MAG TPA: hypothetical protein VIH72_12385, partial [Candidatus Acidoferrales bacterium]